LPKRSQAHRFPPSLSAPPLPRRWCNSAEPTHPHRSQSACLRKAIARARRPARWLGEKAVCVSKIVSFFLFPILQEHGISPPRPLGTHMGVLAVVAWRGSMTTTAEGLD